MAANETRAAVARAFLERRGYEVLDDGAADGTVVVARDGDGTLAFIEASMSAGPEEGFPEEGSRRAMRRRLEAASTAWLAGHRTPDARVRFDALAIVPMAGGANYYLRHHVDALAQEG